MIKEQRILAFDIILCGDSHANYIGPHFKAQPLTQYLMTKNFKEGVHDLL